MTEPKENKQGDENEDDENEDGDESSDEPMRDAAPRINRPPVLFHKTQKLIAQIEDHLGAAFLSYWTSVNGSVCDNDAAALHEILQSLGERDRVAIFLKSDGGSGLAALRVVHLLRHFSSQVWALVPLDCASAATMVALGADEIHMGPLAYLTAVDSSLTHELSPVDIHNRLVSVSQDELMRVVALWRHEQSSSCEASSSKESVLPKNGGNPYQALFQYVHPLVIGAVDRSISLSIKVCTEILSYHMSDHARAEAISMRLNNDYPAHDYPITFEEARRIGLPVMPLDAHLNRLLLELNKLYSEMGQKAYTYFDEHHSHDNEILNIMEGRGVQVYYQNDTDRHYRQEERRWVRTNDQSSWRKIEKQGARTRKTIFHIR